MIWEHIVPFRQVITCCPSPTYTTREVYDSIISSLESWFAKEPFTPVNFALWSIATMVTVMRNLSQDLEVRAVFFDVASQDIRNIFNSASSKQVGLLSRRLIDPTSLEQTKPIFLFES
jgi:hypothetical protein